MIYRALDYRFQLDVGEHIEAALRTALEPLLEPTDAQSGGAIVDSLRTPPQISSEREPGRAVAATLEVMNRNAAAGLTGMVPLHAAATRHPDGGVVALAGSSGAGKSTLGTAALLAGWGFLAEEIAAVDPRTLRVRPYHRPVGLRRGGAAALGIPYPDVSGDGDSPYADVFPWPVPVDQRVEDGELFAVALVERQAGRPELSRVRPAAALAELVEHTVVPDDDRVVEIFRELDDLVRRVPAYRLRYDTPAQGVALLDELART